MLERVFLAADELSFEQCLDLASKIGKRIRGIKVHSEFDRQGPTAVQ